MLLYPLCSIFSFFGGADISTTVYNAYDDCSMLVMPNYITDGTRVGAFVYFYAFSVLKCLKYCIGIVCECSSNVSNIDDYR